MLALKRSQLTGSGLCFFWIQQDSKMQMAALGVIDKIVTQAVGVAVERTPKTAPKGVVFCRLSQVQRLCGKVRLSEIELPRISFGIRPVAATHEQYI